MGWHATCAYIAPTTGGCSHSPSATRFAIIHLIRDLASHLVWTVEARGIDTPPIGPVPRHQTPRCPVPPPRRWMGTLQSISCCIPSGCVSTPPSGFFSPSVTWYQNRRITPPGWPVPVRSPWHTVCWLYRWQSWVGMGPGVAAMAATCAVDWRNSGLVGGRLLASLSIHEKKEGKRRKIPVLATVKSMTVFFWSNPLFKQWKRPIKSCPLWSYRPLDVVAVPHGFSLATGSPVD